MKKIIFLLVLILAALPNITAAASASLVLGTGYNYLSNTDAQSGWAPTFGFHFYIPSDENVGIHIGVLWDRKKGVIKDQVLGGTYTGPVYTSDITYDITFFEINAQIRSVLKQYKAMKGFVQTGPAVKIGMRDNSSIINKTFIRDIADLAEWDEMNYYFRYATGDVSSAPYILKSSGFAWNFAMGLNVPRVEFLVQYSMHFFEIHTLDRAELDTSMNTLTFMMSVDLGIILKPQ